ncbi:MAG: hypothetical protein AAF747_11140 [Planctomycetota bacterium]
MLRVAARWAPGLLALLVIGPVVASLAGGLASADGGSDASFLPATNPVAGIIALAVGVLAAGVLGIVTSRFVSYRIATWTVGYMLAWVTWRTTTVPDLIRVTRDAGYPTTSLIIEGVVVGIAGLLLAIAVIAFGRDVPGHESDKVPGLPVTLEAALAGPMAAVVVLVSAAAAMAGAWLVVLDPLKGQAVFGGVVAGLLAGAAGTWVAAALRLPTTQLPIFAGLCLAPVLGTLSGGIVHGGGLAEASYATRLFGPAALLPLDWIAGGFMGLPAGCAIVTSLFEDRAAKTAAA